MATRQRRFVVPLALAVLALGAGAFALWSQSGPRAGAEPSAEVLALGRTLYAEQCASCHGADLEGAPDWQRPGPNGRLPAPPHDATGHTWHHDDELLFRITKYGSAAVVGGGYQSDMLGFGEVLTDAEIQAVLAFIKNEWPVRERAFQAELSRRADSSR